MRYRQPVLALFFAVLSSGCVENDVPLVAFEQAPGATAPAGGDFSLTVAPSSLDVPPGTMARLAVHIARLGPSVGPITLGISDLPRGVHASPIVLHPTEDDATIELEADPSASLVPGKAVKVHGTAGELDRSAVVDLMSVPYSASLDEDFGSGGLVTLDGPVIDVREQPDGRIVALLDVFSATGAYSTVEVCRLESYGGLDAAFGEGGCLKILSAYSTSLQLTPDGIVVAGILADSRGFLARLTDNGERDAAFGFNGVLTTPKAITLLRSAGPNLLVAGAGSAGGYLERRFADGTKDDTFAIAGTAGLGPHPEDLLVLADGRFLELEEGDAYSAPMLRAFLSDGAPDLDFHSSGSYSFDAQVMALGVVRDEIMVSGQGALWLARLTLDGDLIAEYPGGDPDGDPWNEGNWEMWSRIAFASDGSVLFGGSLYDDDGASLALGHRTLGFERDATYGRMGIHRFARGDWGNLRVLGDGRVLLFGSSDDATSSSAATHGNLLRLVP